MRNHICFGLRQAAVLRRQRILDFDRAAHRLHDAGEFGDDRVAPGVHLPAVVAREKLRHDRAIAVQPLERHGLVGRHQGAVALGVGEEDGRELAFHRKGWAVRRPHVWADCGKNPRGYRIGPNVIAAPLIDSLGGGQRHAQGRFAQRYSESAKPASIRARGQDRESAPPPSLPADWHGQWTALCRYIPPPEPVSRCHKCREISRADNT